QRFTQAPLNARSTPLWWWQFHQVAMSGIYVAMMYPGWYLQRWLGESWGILFLLAVLAPAAWATSLRLHLRFLARHVANELAVQRARTLPWLRVADAGFAASQFVGAVAIGP